MSMRKYMALAGFFLFLMTADVLAGRPTETQPRLGSSPRPVTISMLNRFPMAPIGRTANIVLVVRVEKHEGNRDVEVSCDGLDGGIYVSSGKLVDGEAGKEIFDLAFNLTPAVYRCEAVLKRKVDGKTKEFTSAVEVTVY